MGSRMPSCTDDKEEEDKFYYSEDVMNFQRS